MGLPAADLVRREANAFWRFSLHTYRLPGIEAACLVLQDRCGTDTNLLLYCCWLGTSGRSLDRRVLRRAMAAVALWQAEVIRPLRQARRALKAAPLDLPDGWAADLRKRIGAVELDLEYLEQCVLAKQAQNLPPQTRRQPPRVASQASLARYLTLMGVLPTALERQQAGTVLDACCPPPPMDRQQRAQAR